MTVNRQANVENVTVIHVEIYIYKRQNKTSPNILDENYHLNSNDILLYN